MTNGIAQITNYYLWCGSTICESRDAGGANILRRLFQQGEVAVGEANSTNYYFTRDLLGSIIEVGDSAGQLVSRYGYDPFGQMALLTGTFQATFGFTGHFIHQKSGLYLTWFRALDSTIGRWLSRDPLGEHASVDLYVYVANNPLNQLDIYGLDSGPAGGCGKIPPPPAHNWPQCILYGDCSSSPRPAPVQGLPSPSAPPPPDNTGNNGNCDVCPTGPGPPSGGGGDG